MRNFTRPLFPMLLIAAGCGTSGGGGAGGAAGGSGQSCVPGASVACACTTGQEGAQVCNTSGTGFGACVCSGLGGAGAGGGALAGAGGSGVGGSAGGRGGAIAGAAGSSAGGGGGGGAAAGAGGFSGGAGTMGQAGSGGAGGATSFVVFPIPSGGTADGITVGSDGNLWFVETVVLDNVYFGAIGRITPTGAITEYLIPVPPDLAHSNSTNVFAPSGSIAAGPDGNLWFTSLGTIGRITTAGVITQFTVPQRGATAIAAGPDGRLWFTQGGAIGTLTTAGVFGDTFPIPFVAPQTGVKSQGISAGPDGGLWFSASMVGPGSTSSPVIGRVTIAGAVTTFPISSTVLDEPTSGPPIAGPGGNVWFAMRAAVGVASPSGAITNLAVPIASSPGAGLTGSMAVGPDGNVWLTEEPGALVRMTPSGTTVDVVDQSTQPGVSFYLGSIVFGSIVAGPDGNIWFGVSHALGVSSGIGRVTL